MTLSAQSWGLAFTYLSVTWHISDSLKYPWPDEDDVRKKGSFMAIVLHTFTFENGAQFLEQISGFKYKERLLLPTFQEVRPQARMSLSQETEF